MRKTVHTLTLVCLILIPAEGLLQAQMKEGMTKPEMMFGDVSRTGSPFSKDPHVIYFRGRYLMY